MTTRPVADDLFVESDGSPHLVGSRCSHCDTTTFPQQQSCPRCTRWDMVREELPNAGTLWSFTVQGFRPKAPYLGPEEFAPYGVGYVDLDGRILVESRLTESDPGQLRIGSPVELVLEPLRTETDGTVVNTFAFAPRAER
jgi:uncharacterized OB-fold protein